MAKLKELGSQMSNASRDQSRAMLYGEAITQRPAIIVCAELREVACR